jgi:hypothetical protein
MMVHFRKRIGPDLIKVCNDLTKANGIAMIQEMLVATEQADGTDPCERKQHAAIEEELGVKPASLDPGSNWGTLILDETCVPDDIPYPVDLRLLAESRDTTERVIDELFKQLQGKIARKPRCNSVKSGHGSPRDRAATAFSPDRASPGLWRSSAPPVTPPAHLVQHPVPPALGL